MNTELMSPEDDRKLSLRNAVARISGRKNHHADVSEVSREDSWEMEEFSPEFWRAPVALGEEERIVKQYRCMELHSFSPRGLGWLTVTTKRIIYDIEGWSIITGRSRRVFESNIEQVTGVGAYYGGGIRVKNIFATLFLGIITGLLYYFFRSGDTAWPYMVSGALAVISILLWWQTAFSLRIFIGASTPLIEFGDMYDRKGLLGAGASYGMRGAPGPDADKMISELGIVIEEIKKTGTVSWERERATHSALEL